MFKFKFVEDAKVLVDEKGMFIKTEGGEHVPAPEGAEEFVEEAQEEVTEPTTEGVDEVKAYIKSMSAIEAQKAIDALNLGTSISSEVKKTLGSLVSKASGAQDAGLDAEKIMGKLKSIKDGDSKNYEFKIKTLSELSSLTGEVILEDRQEGITRDVVREPWIEEIASVEATASNKVTWVEVLTETGAPATTAELAAFPNKDYTFGVQSADVVKVAVSSKASNEILEDAPQLVSFVRTSLMEDLNLKVDTDLLSGTGTAELAGILSVAPTFTGGALALSVQDANKFDVLRAALMEIRVAGKGKFRPTHIALNPTDTADLDMQKSATDGHYIMPPFSTADRTVIKGVRIIENTGITAGDFLVGDFKKLHVVNRRGMSIQVASENEDDFLKDMITMRLSRRLVAYVRTNEVGAFVQGDFAAAITAIDLP